MKSDVASLRAALAAQSYWFVQLLLISSLSLLTILSWRAACFAAQPDLGKVSDILQGQRYLLRDDDVIFLLGVGNGSSYQATETIVPSSNSNFSGPVSTFTNSLNNSGFTPFTSVALGRFYNTGYDDLLIVGQQPINGNQAWVANLRDPKTGATFTQQIPSLISPLAIDGGLGMQIVKGDFTGDGFEDAAIAYYYATTPPLVGINIVTVANVNSNDSALTFGAPIISPTNNGPAILPATLVAGDFAGNGVYGLAALMSDYQTVQLFAVNPQTLQISAGQSVQLPFALASGGNSTLVAGRFNDASHDQLAAIGQMAGAKKFAIISVAVDHSTLAPTVGQAAFVNVKGGSLLFPISNVIGKAAPLTGKFGVQDQLIIGFSSLLFGGIIQVGSFDDTFLFHRASTSQLSTTEPTCLYNFEAGNFDNRDSGGKRIANYEIAAFYLQGNNSENFACPGASSGPQNLMAEIFRVNATGSDWLVPANQYTLSTFSDGIGSLANAQMVIGDSQGRSLRLGAPDKVTVEGKIQPDIVLGIPPMHVDYVRPNFMFNPATHPGCQDPNTPCDLNLTVRPSVPAPGVGFATKFNFSSSASTSSSRQATTSWGFGIKGSNETKATYGLPFVASVSVDLKASVQSTHEGRVSKAFNTYSAKSDSLTATTGFADHVFFSQVRQNIYYYPVLGQMTCPSTIPNCASEQKTQLYVAFSAPDRVSQGDLDATTLDWYQPAHEPGNILSYPWDLDHLQSQFTENLSPQTTTPAPCRGTDTSKISYSTTWSSGSGNSQTSGSSNAFSTDVSLSVAGSAFGVSDQVSVGVDDSSSMSTLQQSTQTLSASEGITITKPVFGSDVAQCCLYDFGSYLFGLGNPNGTFQKFDLTNSSGKPINVQTTGPLVVGFVSNPTPNGNDELSCGGAPAWWQQVYNFPDVGLIHPERWDWTKQSKTASFNPAQPGVSPLVQPFYHATGLFISEHGTSGPSITEARQGDQITLTAQIYNLSLRDTDDPTLTHPAASIHVRFYGQIYNAGNLDGNSFLIGETTLPNVPALKSIRYDGPNWRYASVPFDTSPYGGSQYMVFWIVTWMEDAANNLVPEMPDHGLTADPTNLSFSQITDVPTQVHSNNVGMYPVNSPFFIADKNSPPGAIQGGEALAIDDLALAGPTVRDRRGEVDLRLHATSASASNVTVTLFQRGPEGRRKLLALQRVPYIPADGDYLMRAIVRPELCGATKIIATATAGDGISATSTASAHIACKEPRRSNTFQQ